MFRAVVLLVLASISLLAQSHVLVGAPEIWRFRPVSTNTVEPDPAWKQLDYDDSTWLFGADSFGTASASLGGWPETHVLPYEGASAYVFRKKFQVQNPESFRSLILRIDYEHGFVAYLNGNTVAQRGFGSLGTSSNNVPLTAPAQYHPRGRPELIDLTDKLGMLSEGTNLLAIQVHTAGVEDRDVVMATELTANFIRGPFIQNATTNSIQIIWRTLDETTGAVTLENPEHEVRTEFSAIPATNHVITLTNLLPNTEYSYRVYSQRDGVEVAADPATFRTLKARGQPINFLVFGDTGQITLGQYAIADRMKQTPTDLVMHVGDVVYPYFADIWADQRCFSVYRYQMERVPFFFTMGNHDGVLNLTDYTTAFYLPTNNVTGTEVFYSFDHGDAHFIVLATDTLKGQSYHPESQQYAWLEADLAATTQPWKFIFFHHIIRSSSLHSRDDYLFDGVWDKYAIQMYIGGLAERYGAQVIFNGHDHNYERFASFNGVNSFVAGGGGASLYPQAYEEPGGLQYRMSFSFLNVAIDGPQMKVEALDQNGAVLDRLYRSQVSAETMQSSWGSPLVEASAGVDLTGNTPGQVFPFNGQGASTRAGLWANLGRLHVRNDSSYIYVGFEQAAIHDNQVIALFLENPDAPGVSDLGPLGDGTMNNEVDGLDLLNMLSFQNFRPSIGCLLGDEFGDANLRSYKRTKMRWSTGQGVYKLDAEFTSVTGSRLQQFSRSPQNPPKLNESNADLIALAIPRTALGNPTNQLRLGAIVFSDRDPGPMVPEIDTAYAGKSLSAPGAGRYVLEPMIVTLAPDPNPLVDAFDFRAEWISPTQIRFTWNSVPGAQYWIQTTPELLQSFQDSQIPGFAHTAIGVTCTIDVDATGIGAPQFFRLRTN